MWDKIIGQTEAKSLLSQVVSNERVAHAYLFHGPYGVGKRAAAFCFAQALQCESDAAQKPCGVCSACQKSAKLQHPDTHIYFPTPKDTKQDDIINRNLLLAQDPYAFVDYVRLKSSEKASNKKSAYRVDFIREELSKKVSFALHEGQYRVVVLLDVENMNPNASNAFLKLLEEPRERTVFILITQSRARLLPTLVSRCQPLRFRSIDKDILSQVLVDRHGLSDSSARSTAISSFGSYSVAKNSLESERDSSSDDVLMFIRAAATSNFEQIEGFASTWKKQGREAVKGTLMSMLNWTRDLTIFKEVNDSQGLSYPEYSESYSKFWDRFPGARVDIMVDEIESASINVDKNVSLSLLLVNLGMTLSTAIKYPE